MIISVKTNVEDFRRSVRRAFEDQIPFAAARAINDAAEAARKTVTDELPDIFDRPVAFTMRAVEVQKRAQKTDLEAVVGLRSIQAQYLLPQQLGGVRTAASNTMRPASALIEPQQIALNSKGNIPVGAIPNLRAKAEATKAARTMAAGSRAVGGQRKRGGKGVRLSRWVANRITAGVVYIRGGDPQAHGKAGGYFRLGPKTLVPLISFVHEARYKPRFGFHDRVFTAVEKTFGPAMVARFAEAVRTRRA